MYRAGAAVGKKQAIYLHAEVAALVKLKDWSKAYRLVVKRFTRNGEPANARPCALCQQLIRKSGIKVIEHT